ASETSSGASVNSSVRRFRLNSTGSSSAVRATTEPSLAVRDLLAGDHAAGHPTLLQVPLVIVLGRIERRRRDDLRDDRAREIFRVRLFRCGRGGGLLVVVREDRGAVLVPDVGPLAVQLRRIVDAEEDVEQLVVRDLVGIELDLDGLGVSGGVTAD